MSKLKEPSVQQLSKWVLQHLLDRFDIEALRSLPEGGLTRGSVDIAFNGMTMVVKGDVQRKNGNLKALDGIVLRPDDKSARTYIVKKAITSQLYEFFLEDARQDTFNLL